MTKRILAALLVFALVISNVPVLTMATEIDATAPTETTPQETLPEETVPEESVPEESVPEETVPEETAPEESVPEESVPEESVPEETVPEETVPEETVPEETVPEESVPEETQPEIPAPDPNADKGWDESTGGHAAPEAEAAGQGAMGVPMTMITEGQWEGYYPVTTAQELNAIRNQLDGKFVLMNDIVFSSSDFKYGGEFYNDGAGWKPIGTYSNPFSGTFDGNGHTVSNLYINYSDTNTVYAGLFGYCAGAALRNVGVVNCDVTGKALENTGYANTAALAGSIQNTTVSNCYATGSVTGSRTTGGVIGYVDHSCTVTDCYNKATVTGKGYTRAYTGGLVGYVNDNITVKNSFNAGTVTASISKPSDENAYCATGGITSYVQNGEDYGPSQLINCWNTADITIKTNATSSTLGNYTVGGVVGQASGKLENCYNTGKLDADVAYLGGVAGRLYAEATGCFNKGTVKNSCVDGYHNAGGIIGLCGNGSYISRCYNTGEVSSSSRSGGIVGYAYQTVSNCYNIGKVTATEMLSGLNVWAGGIAAYSKGSTITECWNNGTVSGFVFGLSSYVYAYGGGIIGAGEGATITDTFNAGTVTCSGSSRYTHGLYSGGIVGSMTGGGTVKTCYNAAKASIAALGSGYTIKRYGGLAASADSNTSFTNCYYINSNSEGVDSGTDSGTKCTATQMKTRSTFSGFDFGSTWTMAGHSDYEYPELQSNPVKEHATSVSFVSKPTKTDYLQFVDELDVSGGVLKLTYNTGKTENKTITRDMVSGFDNTYDGEQSLKVTCDGMSVYYTVNIIPMESISLLTKPTKTDYLQYREELDISGASLVVTYENGAQRGANLTADMVSGFDNMVAGPQTLTVTLGWLTTTFQVNIVPITAIAVTKLPDKTSYLRNTHELDLTGGELTATYENGAKVTVALAEEMVSGFDNTVPGRQTLTVLYYDLTTTFDVFILDLDAIAVTRLPDKVTYLEAKEELDVTGGEITLYYNDGTSETMAMTPDMVTGFDNTVVGLQTLTVQYKGKTATFEITILEKTPVSIELIQMPRKLKFALDTGKLDVTGGMLSVVYDNDTENAIPLTEDMVSGFDNSQLGVITLTVTYGGLTTTYDVEICLIRTITLAEESLHMFTGNTKTLKAKLHVHEPSLAPAKTTLVWESSNKSVATVTSKGKITAKGVGEATITCYAKDDPDVCATATLTVTKAVSSIKLDKTTATITIGAGEELGKTYQLNIKSISPSTATDQSVTWTSSNEAVVTVDQEGLVTSVGAGTATVKVTANDGSGKSASCKVTVKIVKVSKVSLPSSYTLTIGAGEELGKTAELNLKITPTDAHNQTLEWTSSKPSVATVDENGVVTSVGEGTTTIKARALDGSGKSATCKLTVKLVKLTSLKLPKTATIGIGAGEDFGKTLELEPTFSPSEPYASELTWKSSKESVATVDENGIVTSVAPGTATITCKDLVSGKSATCSVTVKVVKLSSLKLPKTVTLGIGAGDELGKTLELTATLNPADPYESNLTWKSSRESVATVDENGVVTSVGEGTATITCKDTVSGKSATCKVTVKILKLTSLKLPKTATIGIGAGEDFGKTLELEPTLTPDNPYESNLTWKSSKESVATVDENGIVTSVAPGTATITCKDTVSGKSATCKVTVKILKITSLKLPKTAAITIGAGEEMGKTLELEPTISPAEPYNATLIWTSSKESVATVDENGVVTSVAPGTATITAKATDGSGKSAKCTVTVSYRAVTKLTVSTTKLKLALGETAALTAKVTPSNAYAQTVTWTSSKPSVVSVTEEGSLTVLKAEGTGSATVTCSCGGKKVSIKVTVVANRTGNPTTAEKNALALAVAKQIADASTGSSDLERVSKAAQAVAVYCNQAEYTSADPDYRTPYGVFVKGLYTCSGATRAMGMVLEVMGFQWDHVNENQNAHQWCVLTMDGQEGYADGQVGWAGYGKHPVS